MPKKPEESYQEYRDRVVDSISHSFCGAKWYNATVWLGSGTTASCHHPPAHKIPVSEIKRNYKALHNTDYKKLVREQMLRGERPKECEYCWKIEDLGKDKVSDRVYKSIIYTDEDLQRAKTEYGSSVDVDLKTLEIAFDATCNFACSYCNPSFSTTWMADVKMNGPYQNLVSDGAGAFHLEILVDRMKREFKVEANVGKPQVAFRETIRKAVPRHDYTHKKQTGGSGQFAKIQIALEPMQPGENEAGYEFVNKITGGRVPKEYIPSVDDGCQEAMAAGPLAGYPLTDVRVTLLDGAYHDVDSSELAFKIAGIAAFKEASRLANPVLLEPVMSVEVITPEDFMGDVIGDLNSRRGQIQAMDERSGARVVRALVPLSEMFGYVGDLRSRTQGRASYLMQFDSYAEVPAAVAKEIIAKVRGE